MIKILLLEAHVVVRQGLRLLIEKQPDMEIVHEASDLEGAFRAEADPDVIIADPGFSGRSGPSVVVELSKRFLNSKIVVVTSLDNHSQLHLCLIAGAAGYLLKKVAVDHLIEAIRKVSSGEVVIDPSWGNGIAEAVERGDLQSRKPLVHRLTAKELQLARLVALGHTNTEMAAMMSVSIRTIETRRSQVMSKLGLENRAELVMWAIDRGVAQSPAGSF